MSDRNDTFDPSGAYQTPEPSSALDEGPQGHTEANAPSHHESLQLASPRPSPSPRSFQLGGLALAPAASAHGGARFALSPALLPQSAPRPSEDPYAGLTAFGPVASERKVRDWALVLQSASLWHVIRRSQGGWVLLVRDEDYVRASSSIDRYEEENRDWPPRPVRERVRHPTSPFIPLLFASLIAFFLVTGPAPLGSRWFQHGTATTHLILSSEPWRAVTALTLHFDSEHVLSNALSGTIFGSAVQRRLGSGGAALAIVASGVLGNIGNALWHQAIGDPNHRSIGASTAIFGAIGLLAATQLVLNRPARKQPRTWTEIAAPLVGGLALLGSLGASPNTDIGAHLFGFLGGVLIGLLAAFPLRRGSVSLDFGSRIASHTVELGSGAPRAWVQAFVGAIAATIVLVSWQLARIH